MTYSEYNKQIQDLMRKFDSEYKTKGFEAGGSRFIKVDGKNLDQIEYVKNQLEKLNK